MADYFYVRCQITLIEITQSFILFWNIKNNGSLKTESFRKLTDLFKLVTTSSIWDYQFLYQLSVLQKG